MPSLPARPAQPSQPTEHITIPLVGLEGFGERRAAQAERAAQALGKEPGVRWAHVSAETEMAYVRYDPARATVAALMAAITRTGLRAGEPSHR